MPSRRKSAHTTKIERVPRFEVYHGEEDIDDELGSDGTLDLSMKRVKVEPIDYSDTREASPTHLGESAADSSVGAHEGAIDGEEQVERSASSCGDKKSRSVADDNTADASSTSDHVAGHIDIPSSTVDSAIDERLIVDSNAPVVTTANGLQLFAQTGKGKTVRPFKLYTSNRGDLLSGLSTQGASTLATYPIALAAVPPGSVPLAFTSVPLVSGAPSMIPQTAASSSTSATSSAAAMGADTDTITSSTSSPTSNTTAKSTSSTTDAHLMTLATEADKILRERHASDESSTGSGQDSMELEGSTADSNGTADHDSEEGTVLKIPMLSSKISNGDEDSLTFIQKRAVAAAVAASSPHKSKKKRQTLPDQMKDLAYWERRRKNNEAAKRSRDARRAKEDQIAIRAALLEQENIRLKIEVNALKEETATLRSMLYANNNK